MSLIPDNEANEIVDPDVTRSMYQALICAQQKMPPIPKNKTVEVKTQKGKYSYKYADLTSILEIALPVLNSCGVALFQAGEDGPDGSMVLTTMLMHEDGGQIVTSMPLRISSNATPQEMGSAMAYAKRYAVCAALGLAPDEDDDGQAASRPQANRSTPPRPGSTKDKPADTLGIDGATKFREELDKFGFHKAEQFKFASAALDRTIKSFEDLPREDANHVWTLAKKAFDEAANMVKGAN